MAELTPPWLNDLFIKEVIQSVEESNAPVEVIKYRCHSAVPPGTNYLGLLYRVSVEYKLGEEDGNKTVSLIVKTPLESGALKALVEEAKFFQREFTVYNEYFPKLYELQDLRLTARSYYCPLKESLVLEDLSASGYIMADRQKQLDYQQCRKVMENLARLHALSVAAVRKHPDLFKDPGQYYLLNDKTSQTEKQQKRNMVNGMLERLADTADSIAGCQRYAKLIRMKIPTYWDEMARKVLPGDGLNVLNHSDIWTNNIMFKYNEKGEVVDAKLVDFQQSRFCSFSQDVLLFWWSSANEDVREQHEEELFQVYRQTLNELLQELGCPEILSREEFYSQMRNNASFVLIVLCVSLPPAFAEARDLLDYNEINKNDLNKNLNKRNMQNKKYKAILPKLLEQAENIGTFS